MELSPAALAVAGRCEGRINELARRMTGQAFERLPRYEELPGEVKDVEMAATARHAVRLFLRRVEGRAEEGDLEYRYFRERAAQRAEEGCRCTCCSGRTCWGSTCSGRRSARVPSRGMRRR
ncbi:hypothetical protein ACFQ0T_12670 [Kitasatospora gansuensis]